MMQNSNPLKSRGLAAIAVAALALGALGAHTPPAWASMVVQVQVTGQVSAVEGTTAVTINGTTYLIAANSPAYQTIQSVKVGDTIGLVLDGPSGASTTQVVGIVTDAAAGSGSSGAGSGDSGTSSQ
jgi:hypothetical protein